MPKAAPIQCTRLDLGIVSFEVTESWRFFPMAGRIVGRPTSGVGVMQIVRLPAGVVPPSPSHELCMAAAKQASGYAHDGPGMNRAKEHADNCLAGAESFEVGADLVRVWYRHCPDGLVAAWYAVGADRAKERSVVRLMNEGDRMIATIALPPPLV